MIEDIKEKISNVRSFDNYKEILEELDSYKDKLDENDLLKCYEIVCIMADGGHILTKKFIYDNIYSFIASDWYKQNIKEMEI